MSTQRTSTPAPSLDHPRTAVAFRKIKLLVGGYLGISALAVVAIVLLRHHSAEVNSAVWTHGSPLRLRLRQEHRAPRA